MIGAAPAEPEPDLTTPVGALLTIGEVARAADVATSALRFYEAEGLVIPAGRTAVGYRLYDPEQIARVRFIRHAQRLGLSLAEVGELLAAVDSDDPVPTRDRLRHLVGHKLVTTRQHITELQEFTSQLQRVHQRLSGNPGCGCRHLGSCGCLPLDLPSVEDSDGELETIQTGACGCGCGPTSAAP
ncbi:MerR family transcriptional regulator [Rhodococcus antarcticus]|uniref:MerR family transcriptional regulator n=1 Tax=Rhodococcus antarcticus TaxID=2987751 RepID=A0ABY6NW83_9NOCA|nr:MerR family transcriptional regulator [Rhodococcus antarcticus]UZJ23641.1 MerR family transcriptional regulator [Rhodococcus antarcticus]